MKKTRFYNLEAAHLPPHLQKIAFAARSGMCAASVSYSVMCRLFFVFVKNLRCGGQIFADLDRPIDKGPGLAFRKNGVAVDPEIRAQRHHTALDLLLDLLHFMRLFLFVVSVPDAEIQVAPAVLDVVSEKQ